MIVDHQDTLKNELLNISFLESIKLNDLKNLDKEYQKNDIDYKGGNIYNVDDAFLNIFPSLINDEYNTEYSNYNRIYEITNNT
jgi:hypothetical protein